jgi:AraC-like DNA-binding protein
MQGRVDAFTIVFQPGGLFALLSVPAKKLTNDDFDGEAVLGSMIGELERRMAEVSLFADRVRIANQYLSARLSAPEAVGMIARTAAKVLMNDGCARVSDLAHATGLSIRQFERRFRYQIGTPPKLYARFVRFEAALRSKAAAPATQWTDIAHAPGYHDQMHMVHDFNSLSGDSPTAISGRLDMFVHPQLVSAG